MNYVLSLICLGLGGLHALNWLRERDGGLQGLVARQSDRIVTLEEQLAERTRAAEEVAAEARLLLRASAQRSHEAALEQAAEPVSLRGLALNADYPDSAIEERIGERAFTFILGHEITSRALYEAQHNAPQTPIHGSGVTIGVGYDLGWRTESDFRAEWAALGAASVDLLASAVGKRGEEAAAVFPAVKDVAIPYELARKVFVETTLVDAAARMEALFPEATKLPSESYGALVSLVMNRGYALESVDEAESRREMKAIRSLLEAGRYDLVGEQIRAMKWLWWRGGDAVTGLMRRREEEAALFEEGLRRLVERRAESPP